MTTAEEYTWDVAEEDGGPSRATLADLGGADMLNEEPLPDEEAEMTAAKGNQWAQQLAGMNRMIGSAHVYLRYSGGDPGISAAYGMGSEIGVDTFETTDEGTGITLIEWDPVVLPVPILPPSATLNDSTQSGGATAEYVTTDGVVTGVRVKSWTGASTAADRNVLVTIR